MIHYLGANISSSPRFAKFWEPLVSKISGKLSSWQGKLVNHAGKAVLLKAAIDSIPLYWFHLFLIPKSIEHKIECIRKKFFWGTKGLGAEERSKMHLVSWNKICSSKKVAGLGLTTIRHRNIAFLYKWWWRSCAERNSFWNRFMQSKYDADFAVSLSKVGTNKTSSFIFKNIIQAGDLMDMQVHNSFFYWQLGNGNSALFWEDIWIGHNALRDNFPRLYEMCNFKDVKVNFFVSN